MDRRDLLKGVVGVTAAGMVAGCTSAAPSTGAADSGAVTLRCAWWGSEDRHAKTNAALELFQTEHPTIAIMAEGQAYDGYFDKLATQMAARDAPDVIQIAVELVKEYASTGSILSLTAVDLTDLDPSTTRQALIDGEQRAVASGLAVTNVVANATLFRAAGVPMPDDTTWTWDEFTDLAARISQAGGEGVYGTGPIFQDWNLFAAFVRQLGPTKNIFTDDGALGFDAGDVEAFLLRIQALVDTGAAPDAAASFEELTKPLEQSGSATNRFAMGFWPSSQYAAVVTASGQELVPLRLPSHDGTAEGAKMGLGASQFWAVAASSSHPDEAQQVIDFLVNSVDAGKILEVTRGSASSSVVRAAVEPELTDADAVISAFITEIQPETAYTPLPPPGASQLQEVMRRHISTFMFGQSDAAATAQALVTEATSTIHS